MGDSSEINTKVVSPELILGVCNILLNKEHQWSLLVRRAIVVMLLLGKLKSVIVVCKQS